MWIFLIRCVSFRTELKFELGFAWLKTWVRQEGKVGKAHLVSDILMTEIKNILNKKENQDVSPD